MGIDKTLSLCKNLFMSEEQQPLLPGGDQSGAFPLKVWDNDLSRRGITQLTQPTKEKNFYFVRDAIGGIFKINFSAGYDPGVAPNGDVTASREPRHTFANIVRVSEDEMAEWLK
jgi:hypothetical protein